MAEDLQILDVLDFFGPNMTALKSHIDEETKSSIATSQSKHAKESEILGTTLLPGPEPQTTMLSEALKNANTAVSLDEAQDFEAAAIAYQETCRLLRQVMRVSSGAEDKRKLQVIVSRTLSTH